MFRSLSLGIGTGSGSGAKMQCGNFRSNQEARRYSHAPCDRTKFGRKNEPTKDSSVVPTLMSPEKRRKVHSSVIVWNDHFLLKQHILPVTLNSGKYNTSRLVGADILPRGIGSIAVQSLHALFG